MSYPPIPLIQPGHGCRSWRFGCIRRMLELVRQPQPRPSIFHSGICSEFNVCTDTSNPRTGPIRFRC